MSPLSIIICVFGLGILAAAHEIGHFLVAKRLGIKVEELSIFVGPSLVTWKRKGIEYHIRLIPFGAYVRFAGLEDEDGGVANPDSFFNQSKWKRLLVSLGGPVTNYLLGIIIFAVTFSFTGFLTLNLGTISPDTQIAATQAVEGDKILSVNGQNILTDLDFSYIENSITNSDYVTMKLRSHITGETYNIVLKPKISLQYHLGITYIYGLDKYGGWTIADVDPGQNDGNPVFKIGDSLLSINGIAVTDPNLAATIENSKGAEITAAIIRDGVKQDVKMKPMIINTVNDRGINILSGTGFLPIMKQSVLYSVSLTKVTIFIISDLITGKVAPKDTLSGPVGIASIVSGVVDEPSIDNTQKIETLGLIAGFISVGLAISNLLPLPGLDGNALVLLSIEMIRGRKLSIRTEKVINAVGFLFLITITIFVLYWDLLRLR